MEDTFPIIAVAAILYLLPALFAFMRRHRNRLAILALTLLLGWTIIGWIVALIWALTAPKIIVEKTCDDM